VAPVAVPSQILTFDLWVMIAITGLVLLFLLLGKGLNRPVGVMFLLLFAGYTTLQYYGVGQVFAGG
jgi:cation:H+ antiporter